MMRELVLRSRSKTTTKKLVGRVFRRDFEVPGHCITQQQLAIIGAFVAVLHVQDVETWRNGNAKLCHRCSSYTSAHDLKNAPHPPKPPKPPPTPPPEM